MLTTAILPLNFIHSVTQLPAKASDCLQLPFAQFNCCWLLPCFPSAFSYLLLLLGKSVGCLQFAALNTLELLPAASSSLNCILDILAPLLAVCSLLPRCVLLVASCNILRCFIE